MSKYIKTSGHYGERWDNALAVDGHQGKPVMGGDYVNSSGHNTRVLSPIAALQAWLEHGGTLTAENLKLSLHRPAGAGVPVPLPLTGPSLNVGTWTSAGRLVRIFAQGGQQYDYAVTILLNRNEEIMIMCGATAIKVNTSGGGAITSVVNGWEYHGYYLLYTPLPPKTEEQEQEQEPPPDRIR